MKKIIVFLVCIALILIATVAYVMINKPDNRTAISFEPSTISRNVGQDFSVNITVSNVADLYGWQLKLTWNATILEAVQAVESTFLKSGGTTFFASKINNTSGYAILDCTLLGNVSGVSGKGTLSTIQLHVKRPGQCDLILSGTSMLNSLEKPIEHVVNTADFSTI